MMEDILKCRIQGVEAELVVTDKRNIVIRADNEIIYEVGGTACDVVEADDWIKHALLKLQVSGYINGMKTKEELGKLAGSLFH